MNNREPDIRGNIFHGYGIRIYCKITEYNIYNLKEYKCSFSFGGSRAKFCMTASYKYINPTQIYIDRVEHNDLCILDGGLSSISEGTAKLVKIGLYAIHVMMPRVKEFTVNDTSHFFCNGENGPNVSLAYETILKYNQTWYGQKFGALLPGYISHHITNTNDSYNIPDGAEQINIPIHNVMTTYIVNKTSVMFYFLKSLLILDEPCQNYTEIIIDIPNLQKYRDEYETAISPRDFFNKLRNKYSRESYCSEIFLWLNTYMEHLNIDLYNKLWYIPIQALRAPPGFMAYKIPKKNVKRTFMKGGTRKRRSIYRNGIKPYTIYRNSKKIQCLGSYEQCFDEYALEN